MPFLLHPVVNNFMKAILISGPAMGMWSLLSGFWIAVYIRSTMKGIYITVFHQLFLAGLMSIVGEQLVYLLPENFSFLVFAEWTLRVFIPAAAMLLVLDHIPEKVTNIITKYLIQLAKFIGPVVQVRAFFRVPSALQLDDRLLLVISLLILMWPQIVDTMMRKLTKMRTPGPLGVWSLVLKQGIAGAISFSMSRKSPVAQFVGLYPFHYSAFLLLPALILLNFFVH